MGLLLVLISLFATGIGLGAELIVRRNRSLPPKGHVQTLPRICHNRVLLFACPLKVNPILPGVKLVKRFIALPLGLGLALIAILLLVQPAPEVRAEGPITLDWDLVDWPDPTPPAYIKTATFPLAVTGGTINVTITVDIIDACIHDPGVAGIESIDDNTLFPGGTAQEALSLVVNYGNAGCDLPNAFARVTLSFDHPTGVNGVTIPIHDLDEDNFQDRVLFSASDGANTFLVNDPNSSFTIANPTVMAFDGVSTFTAIDYNPNVPIDNNAGDANLFVTFNQPGLRTVVFTYTNVQLLIAQGIGLGDITFFADRVDLELGKSVSPTSARVGEVVDFTLTVTNQGPDNATGVVISDTLPSGYTFVSASASQGTYDDVAGLWDVGNLDAGNNATLTISARVNAGGNYTNFAEVESADQFDIDSTPGNGTGNGEDDQASASITIPAPPAEADLLINKVSQPRPLAPGGPINYTIVVTNLGPSAVNGIIVADNLPAEVQSPIYTPNRGTFTPATGSWDVFLNRNDVVTLTIAGTVAPSAAGTIQNTAQVTSTEGITDPNTLNNRSTDTNSATGQVDPSITKQVNVSQASPGAQVVYRVSMFNPPSSTANATQVVLSDPLPVLMQLNNYSFNSTPPGLVSADTVITQVVAAPSNSLGITQTIRYTILLTVPTLAPGAQVNLVATTTVKPIASPGPININNVATMSFAEGAAKNANATFTVPTSSAPPTTGGSDDDDDDDDSTPAQSPPASGQPPAATSTAAEFAAPLPVAFLPETGIKESDAGPTAGRLALILVAVIGGCGAFVWWQRK